MDWKILSVAGWHNLQFRGPQKNLPVDELHVGMLTSPMAQYKFYLYFAKHNVHMNQRNIEGCRPYVNAVKRYCVHLHTQQATLDGGQCACLKSCDGEYTDPAYPVAQQVGFAGADDTAIVPAGRVKGILPQILITDLVLKGELYGRRVITHPLAQAFRLHS